MNDPQTPSGKWDIWPISIIGFFVLAIIGCITFVMFCVSHPTDLVSANYYEQEIRYQSEMERLGRANELGSIANVAYDAAGRRITISLPALHARDARLAGHILLYRPSEAGLDRELPLQPDTNGLQSVDATRLVPGLWQVKVAWTFEGKEFLMNRKIIVIPNSV